MSSVSYNTDKATKKNAANLAAFKGITFVELAKESIKLYADSLEQELRPEASTLRLDPETREHLRQVQRRTQFSISKIIHLCLVKYVEANTGSRKKLVSLVVEEVA